MLAGLGLIPGNNRAGCFDTVEKSASWNWQFIIVVVVVGGGGPSAFPGIESSVNPPLTRGFLLIHAGLCGNRAACAFV